MGIWIVEIWNYCWWVVVLCYFFILLGGCVGYYLKDGWWWNCVNGVDWEFIVIRFNGYWRGLGLLRIDGI